MNIRSLGAAVALVTPHIAVVHGLAEFSNSPYLNETFVVI
jgi:hypothetical protein